METERRAKGDLDWILDPHLGPARQGPGGDEETRLTLPPSSNRREGLAMH
mgnify:CR=1 FL=1